MRKEICKVVGTTFQPIPQGKSIDWEEGEFIHTEIYGTTCVLVPEPTNPYDPNAVQVIVPLDDGTQHVLGYLPKGFLLSEDIVAPVKLWVKGYMFANQGRGYANSYRLYTFDI